MEFDLGRLTAFDLNPLDEEEFVTVGGEVTHCASKNNEAYESPFLVSIKQ